MRPAGHELLPEERRLRFWLRAFMVLTLVFIAGYLAGAITGRSAFAFTANSITKDVLFLAVAAVAAADLRRFAGLTLAVAAGHLVLAGAFGLTLVLGQGSGDSVLPFGLTLPTWIVLVAWAVADLGMAALFTVLWLRAERARLGLRYLTPLAHHTLESLAEVLIEGEDERLPAGEVARNVDGYLAAFRGRGKGMIHLALNVLWAWPLPTRAVPLPALSPADRGRFVHRRFEADASRRGPVGFFRRLRRSLLRAAQQMTYVGYYGDERSWPSIGFTPFPDRPGAAAQIASVDPDRPSVSAERGPDLDRDELEADAVVVGSGAAGAILAHRLAEAGERVIVLERGRHVRPAEFALGREMQMLGDLYADGALQLSRDFQFQALQGSCVGGTTVVNNAVCFDLPAAVRDRWNREHGAGLDAAGLGAAFREVRDWIGVSRQPEALVNRGAQRFREGIERLGLDRDGAESGIVEANIADCFGCGYCNMGCPYGKKLSMLDTVLPWAQQRFGEERFRIVSECAAERIESSGGRATAVVARAGGRRIRVRAGRVVVAAGAIASSRLLLKSRLGGRDVGRGLSFNMASPLTAAFDHEERPLNSFEGLQIARYLRAGGEPGLVLETWFNPPASQALAMPGWFGAHFANMRGYARMTAAGAVVGTAPVGRVHGGPLRDFTFRPPKEDLERLVGGLERLAEIFFAAGATRVMPATHRYLELRRGEPVERLRAVIDDPTDLSLGSAHPQGGNALGRVVDERFRVRGAENVYLCDASVFPTSVTVNPQLTVMALAQYAAPRILDAEGIARPRALPTEPARPATVRAA